MDNLSDNISRLLSDPQTLQQISRLKDLLTVDENDEANTQTAENFSPKTEQAKQNQDTVNQMMKILPMLSDMKKEDDTTRLLQALRPFLSEERRKKLDEAAKIIQFMKFLPLIRQIGF